MNSIAKTVSRAVLAYSTAMWLASVLVAPNAFAEDQVRAETVKFADLNVNTPAGVKALYGRIHAAAFRVCYEPEELIRAKACITKAEGEAVKKLNLPLLTAYYQSKTGIRPDTLIAIR
jgi:UrcA family protein